ncbi:MAG: PQQ-binding-like beta-propeller repeat protein, partial [Catenulispora sp.]|nr:PQQ-binding-like beta-propeller repeat protein [Catenulispora sp.]
DASIVADKDGYIYVGSEFERGTTRSRQLGQMMKLDPRKPGNPVVWAVKDTQKLPKSGIWGSPALYKDIAIFDTHGGDALGLDRETGAVRWKFHLPGGETWQSPVVVDDVLLLGDCTGTMHAYDIADTHAQP